MPVINLRNIIIYRKHEPVLPALYRQLPHELDIMLSALRGYQLKVKIHAVNPRLQRLRDHLVYQAFPMGRITKQLVSLVKRADAAVKVPEGRPHVQVRLVRVIDVRRTRERVDVTLGVRDGKPCRRNRRQPLGSGNRFQNETIRIVTGHVMPCHVNRIINRDVRILRFRKRTIHYLLLRVLQRVRRHVPYKSVRRGHLLPIVLVFQDRHDVRLLGRRQDGTFYSSQITHGRLALQIRHGLFVKVVRDHHPVRAFIRMIIHIRILHDKRHRDISGLTFRFENHVILTLLFHDFCIILASNRNRHIAGGKCIEQDVLIGVPIEPLVHVVPDNGILQINLPVYISAGRNAILSLDDLVVNHHRIILVVRQTIIFFQIRFLI